MSIEVNIRKKLANYELAVSFTCEDDVLAFLGSSGCGKSMTLRCIAGVEKPDWGIIRINGVTCYDSERRINLPPQKRHVGMLFQNYALFPNMTLEENILCGIDRKAADKKKRVEALLEQFHLTEIRNQRPGQMSGGQQQRAALARCLASEPDILLLDEPFSALDADLKSNLQLQMKEELAGFEGSVILVTHDRDEAYLLADNVGIMDRGQILKLTDKTSVFADPGCSIAARLTGCKNVVAARKSGPEEIWVDGWQCCLTANRSVPDQLTAIGIRAHGFKPAGEHSVNRIPVRLIQLTEYPFEWTGVFGTPGPENLIWLQAKNQIAHGKEMQISECLSIDPDAILFLCD